MQTLLRIGGMLLMPFLLFHANKFGMPDNIQSLLWTAYAGQAIILTCRFFGINVEKLYKIMNAFLGIKNK